MESPLARWICTKQEGMVNWDSPVLAGEPIVVCDDAIPPFVVLRRKTQAISEKQCTTGEGRHT